MKIVFEGSEYHLGRLSELLTIYPKSSKLIDFINLWQQGTDTFQFQTSGSTGSPKSIDVNRQQIVASVRATSEYLGLKKSHRVLLCLDPDFVASLMMVARCLINDMDLILKRPEVSPLKSLEHQVDFASFVPLQIYKMIEDGTVEQLNGIKNILIGGAPLSHAAFKALAQIDTNLFATYGMTETVSHIALMPIKGSFVDAYYQVLPDIQVEQDDEGCLKLSGAVTNNEWLQTNDIVERISTNKFRWLGRRDHVINSGGIKIHPAQLEKLIEQYVATDFFISWKTNDELGSECLIITENDPLTADELSQIQQVIAQALSKYYIPKSALSVNQFERTASGKVQREKTRKQALGLI